MKISASVGGGKVETMTERDLWTAMEELRNEDLRVFIICFLIILTVKLLFGL